MRGRSLLSFAALSRALDVAKGDAYDGSEYLHLAYVAGVDYTNPSNHRFCGEWMRPAEERCSIRTHCRDRTDCMNGDSCFEVEACHIQEMLRNELGEDWRAKLAAAESTSTKGRPLAFDRDDPANRSFCGATWAEAISDCSVETHCKRHDDCPAMGHTCFAYLPKDRCNLFDIMGGTTENQEPSQADMVANYNAAPDPPPRWHWHDDPNDVTNFMFCGLDWSDANENCDLSRHCPDSKCERGLTCFGYLSHPGSDRCNAYEMTRAPTLAPTVPPPTASPTSRPTEVATKAPVQITYGLCARNFDHLQQTYRSARECSTVAPCDFGEACFPKSDLDHHLARPERPLLPKPKRSSSPTKAPSALETQHLHGPSDHEPGGGGTSNNLAPDGAADRTFNPELCPLDIEGLHAKDNCTLYYDCADGFVGPVQTCPPGDEFDIGRGNCIPRHLVGPYCYSATLETGVGGVETPAVPATAPLPEAGAPNASPTNVGGVFGWSDTASPTTSRGELDEWTHWEREHANGDSGSVRVAFRNCLPALTVSILAIVFVM